jgi:ribosome-binding factor A
MSRRRQSGGRGYPRTARVNELLREILADELERSNDERLELVTVTGVDAAPDLRHARVWFDSIQGEAGDADVLAGLADARVALQAAIGRQARLKRVPELEFAPDPAVRSGERVDNILRGLHPGWEEERDER